MTPEAARQRIRTAVPAEAQVAPHRDANGYRERVSAGGAMLDWLSSQLQARTAVNSTPAPDVPATAVW
jgi:hypothetical protein